MNPMKERSLLQFEVGVQVNLGRLSIAARKNDRVHRCAEGWPSLADRDRGD